MSGIETVAAVVVTVVAAAASAAAAMQQADAAAKAANFNETISVNNAIGAAQQGAAEADRANLQHRRMLATARASAGASGVDPDSGSPLEVVADLAGQSKLDEELARWQAKQRTQGFAQQATMDRFTGQQARTAGYYGAASSVLQGVSRGVSSYGSGATRTTSSAPRA